MAILHKHQRQTYTVVDNDAVRDDRLSWRATGLLVYLLSLPDGWRPNLRHLSEQKTDGRTSTRSAMGELEAAGYLRQVQEPDDSNLSRIHWHVAESPDLMPETAGSRVTDGRDPENAAPETLTLRSTEQEVLNNEVTTSKPTRARNTYWDAIVDVFGDPGPNQHTLYGRFAAHVKTGGWEPTEIPRRAGLLAAEWGKSRCTVAALEKHWGRWDGVIGQVSDDQIRTAAKRERYDAALDEVFSDET